MIAVSDCQIKVQSRIIYGLIIGFAYTNCLNKLPYDCPAIFCRK